MTEPIRCGWVSLDNPLYLAYHDQEWGVPIRNDDDRLFERVCLEGAQAGLSWITILRKRENYRAAFDGFDAEKVACYDDSKITALMVNAGIVRNRAKILSTINNAKCVLRLQDEVGSFSDFLWSFVGGETRHNTWASLSEIPAETPESRAMSKALKARGFNFVGSTICYAMMQATGMVNDHTVDCFRHGELGGTK